MTLKRLGVAVCVCAVKRRDVVLWLRARRSGGFALLDHDELATAAVADADTSALERDDATT